MPGRLSQSLWDWRLREARAPCADVSSHGAPPMDSTGGAYLRAHTAQRAQTPPPPPVLGIRMWRARQ